MVPADSAYIDTGAFIAFFDRTDSHHALFRQLFSAPSKLITSSLVIAESHTWFLRRFDARVAFRFLSFVEALSLLELRGFDALALEKATLMLNRFRDQSLTLADAHGLVLMSEARNRVCWSVDRHMSLTGIPLVIHSLR